jgi:hypothetical protein
VWIYSIDKSHHWLGVGDRVLGMGDRQIIEAPSIDGASIKSTIINNSIYEIVSEVMLRHHASKL